MKTAILAATQMPMEHMPWHNGGLFMGLHWLWWAFWLVMFAVLVLAFWRLFTDRSATRDRTSYEEAAEAALRQRFARGGDRRGRVHPEAQRAPGNHHRRVSFGSRPQEIDRC